MTMRVLKWTCVLVTAIVGLAACQTRAADSTDFRVGAADKDITPPPGIPMWGYGARHDMLSQGALDPLMAKAIVIAAGDDKVALVGIDLGRGPTEAMMKTIRHEIADKAGIHNVMITGSHSHHGPVIELIDEPGLGKGKFDVAVAYSQKLPRTARRSHPRRRQGPQARQDRRRDRVGQPEPQPAHQTRAEGHRSDAGRGPLRRPGGQADRRARQLRRAPGHDRRQRSSSTRPTTRASSRTRSKPSWRRSASSCKVPPAT